MNNQRVADFKADVSGLKRFKSMGCSKRKAGAIALAIIALSAPALGQSRFDGGGAQIFHAEPGTLSLIGNITPDTPPRFFQALADYPNTTRVDLLSAGGSVYPALAIAWEIHGRRLDTRIADGAICHSACAFLFMAGRNRTIEGAGELGVHQISAADGDLTAEFTQWTMSHILDALATFGTDQAIVTAMLQTGPADMYVLSPEEVDRLGVRRQEVDTVKAPALAMPEPVTDGVTRVAMNRSAESLMGLTYESSFLLDDSYIGPLKNAFTRNGVNEWQATMIVAAFSQVGPDIGLQLHGSELRIFWGPFSNSPLRVPYRVSIYRAKPDGSALHVGTVALSDNGQYVVGLDPDPPRHMGQVTADASGKTDR